MIRKVAFCYCKLHPATTPPPASLTRLPPPDNCHQRRGDDHGDASAGRASRPHGDAHGRWRHGDACRRQHPLAEHHQRQWADHRDRHAEHARRLHLHPQRIQRQGPAHEAISGHRLRHGKHCPDALRIRCVRQCGETDARSGRYPHQR